MEPEVLTENFLTLTVTVMVFALVLAFATVTLVCRDLGIAEKRILAAINGKVEIRRAKRRAKRRRRKDRQRAKCVQHPRSA